MVVAKAGNSTRAAVEEFRRAGNSIMYVQKKIELPGRDLGLVFLGGRYLGTYARVSDGNSWNTTTNSGGRYEQHSPTADVVKLADKAQNLFGLDFTSVDIAETPAGPVVFEVSAFGGFRGLLEADGMDAAVHYVDYVIEKLQP
jgi:ribosomal protein S6--L-glutamate ligase